LKRHLSYKKSAEQKEIEEEGNMWQQQTGTIHLRFNVSHVAKFRCYYHSNFKITTGEFILF